MQVQTQIQIPGQIQIQISIQIHPWRLLLVLATRRSYQSVCVESVCVPAAGGTLALCDMAIAMPRHLCFNVGMRVRVRVKMRMGMRIRLECPCHVMRRE